MKTGFRKFVAVVSAPLLVVLMLGLTTVSVGAQSVSIFSGSGHGFAPIFVADKLGYFQEEGLDVNVVLFASGSAAIQAFRAGHAQFIATGDLPAARIWSEGDVVGLLPLEFDEERMIIAARSTIQTAEDLRGKKVATQTGSTGQYLLARYLNRHGMSLADVNMVNMSPPDMVVALVRGEIDAFSIWQPYGWQAAELSSGRAHILVTGTGLIREYLLLSGRRDYVEEQPEVVAKVLRAVARGAHWLQTANEDERARLVADYVNADVELTRRLLGVIDFIVTIDDQFRATMDDMAAFMQEAGALSGPIRWDEQFDASHARRADPSLVTW